MSAAFWWQERHVELASELISKKLPVGAGVCMLWQPPHSATPPEWKAYEVVLTPTATRAARSAKRVILAIFISPPWFLSGISESSVRFVVNG